MRWTEKQLNVLMENLQKKSFKEIGALIGKSENAIYIKIHRLRANPNRGGLHKERVSNNLVAEILTKRCVDARYFKPTREFYSRIGISQKRFWQLYRGERNITTDEYKKLVIEFKIGPSELTELHQLTLNF